MMMMMMMMIIIGYSYDYDHDCDDPESVYTHAKQQSWKYAIDPFESLLLNTFKLGMVVNNVIPDFKRIQTVDPNYMGSPYHHHKRRFTINFFQFKLAVYSDPFLYKRDSNNLILSMRTTTNNIVNRKNQKEQTRMQIIC